MELAGRNRGFPKIRGAASAPCPAMPGRRLHGILADGSFAIAGPKRAESSGTSRESLFLSGFSSGKNGKDRGDNLTMAPEAINKAAPSAEAPAPETSGAGEATPGWSPLRNSGRRCSRHSSRVFPGPPPPWTQLNGPLRATSSSCGCSNPLTSA